MVLSFNQCDLELLRSGFECASPPRRDRPRTLPAVHAPLLFPLLLHGDSQQFLFDGCMYCLQQVADVLVPQ